MQLNLCSYSPNLKVALPELNKKLICTQWQTPQTSPPRTPRAWAAAQAGFRRTSGVLGITPAAANMWVEMSSWRTPAIMLSKVGVLRNPRSSVKELCDLLEDASVVCGCSLMDLPSQPYRHLCWDLIWVVQRRGQEQMVPRSCKWRVLGKNVKTCAVIIWHFQAV